MYSNILFVIYIDKAPLPPQIQNGLLYHPLFNAANLNHGRDAEIPGSGPEAYLGVDLVYPKVMLLLSFEINEKFM